DGTRDGPQPAPRPREKRVTLPSAHEARTPLTPLLRYTNRPPCRSRNNRAPIFQPLPDVSCGMPPRLPRRADQRRTTLQTAESPLFNKLTRPHRIAVTETRGQGPPA